MASLSTLIYRSRATRPFSAEQLFGLTTAAQKRNRSEGITGLVLYDEDRFFQWLEGPADGLARIVRSINADARHTDIEVLERRPAAQRRFTGWDMRLALADGVRMPWTRDVTTPDPPLLHALRADPARAADLLRELAAPAAVAARRASLVGDLVGAQIIPRLAARLRGTGTGPVDRLAARARSGDVDGALHLVRAGSPSGRRAWFEAVARLLGDGWARDEWSEFEVTLGLCTLQTVLHRLPTGQPLLPGSVGSALVVPHAGELHGLGAALSARALLAAGWDVRCDFPADDDALAERVAGRWFDRLDLSLSPAFPRLHRLDALAATIRRARAASRNPALAITAGGRAFVDDPDLGERLGLLPAESGPIRAAA